MDADAGVSGMEDETGGGVGMIGDAGAGGHRDVGVSGAGHDHGDSAGREQRSQFLREGERYGFFV